MFFVNNNIVATSVTAGNSINIIDVSQCKNFLVRFLADVEQGNELDEVEIERAYEISDPYTYDLKQNSYIHKRWQEFMEKNI